MKQIITALTILTVALLAQAREMTSWSYQELYDQADLVVIAKPISTQDATEKAVLPNISPNVHVVGLSTQFDISVVMKGDKHLKKCVLHHFRLTNPKEIMINGPMLASFDPEQHTRFLLFLHREADGRYSPVSGQTDPTLFSVQKLEGAVSGADEEAWGESVEGVSVRMRADKTRWATNETPTFKLDVRNQGQREFGTTQSQKTGRLEVDGVWYDWTGDLDLKGSWLPPGREYHDIQVSLGSDWKATQEWRDKTQAPPSQIPLKLLPSKHMIRFAAKIQDITVAPKPQHYYVPSNPVEIEMWSNPVQ